MYKTVFIYKTLNILQDHFSKDIGNLIFNFAFSPKNPFITGFYEGCRYKNNITYNELIIAIELNYINIIIKNIHKINLDIFRESNFILKMFIIKYYVQRHYYKDFSRVILDFTPLFFEFENWLYLNKDSAKNKKLFCYYFTCDLLYYNLIPYF